MQEWGNRPGSQVKLLDLRGRRMDAKREWVQITIRARRKGGGKGRDSISVPHMWYPPTFSAVVVTPASTNPRDETPRSKRCRRRWAKLSHKRREVKFSMKKNNKIS